jgi:hypothetical protein
LITDQIPYLAAANAIASGTATITLTVGSNPTGAAQAYPVLPGDLVEVSGGGGTGVPTGVTDTQGHTYTAVNSIATSPASWKFWAIATNGLQGTPATAPDVITVTYSGTGSAKGVVVTGCSFMSTTPLDTPTIQTSSGTSTTPSVTTAAGLAGATQGEMIVATITSANAGGAPNWPGSWTRIAQATTGSGQYTSVAVKINITGTGTVTANPTLSSSVTWTMSIAAYKPQAYKSKGLVGVTAFSGGYPGSGSDITACKDFDNVINAPDGGSRTMGFNCRKTYYTPSLFATTPHSPRPFDTYSDNNIPQLLCFAPARAVAGGTSADRNSLQNSVILYKNYVASQGPGNAAFHVCFWAEGNGWGKLGHFGDGSHYNETTPFGAPGTVTDAQAAVNYQNMYTWYGPTVTAAGIPLIYNSAMYSNTTAVSFFPGRYTAPGGTGINGMVTDYYAAGDSTNGKDLGTYSPATGYLGLASGTLAGQTFSPPLPVGLGEIGASNQDETKATMPTVSTVDGYMTNKIIAPMVAARTNGATLLWIMWYAAGAGWNSVDPSITPEPVSAMPQIIADIANMYDTLQAKATAALEITTVSLPAGTVGTAYSQSLGAANGTAPYTWSVVSGMPAGLTLSPSLGSITGTPTAGGSYSPVFKVTDSASPHNTATATVPITIAAGGGGPSVTTASLPSGVEQQPYAAVVSESGGTLPYKPWALTGGQIPPGLVLSAAGAITGTPTQAGTFSGTYTITDANNLSASAVLSIAIASNIIIETANLPEGSQGQAYEAQLSAENGTAPYDWNLLSGFLPAGVSLTVDGQIAGVPIQSGSFIFTAQVTDGAGTQAQVTLSLFISAAPTTVFPFDSLVIDGKIELMGGRAFSPLPQCQGAQFQLAPGYDLSMAQPTTDIVASLLFDGERPYGRRFSNRTIVLPIVIQAPDRPTLAAAREILLETIDQQTWELTWTRSGGSPLVFDCFRAQPTVITYSTKTEKDGLASVLTLTVPALPFARSRSDSLQQLAFPATILGGPVTALPSLIDDYNVINTTTQPSWWRQSVLTAVDVYSAWWEWSVTDENSAPLYTSALVSPVNISGLAAVNFWLGLGTQNYLTWHKGTVTFAITLTDADGNTISFGADVYCYASDNNLAPWWNQVTIAIPQNVQSFDYVNVASYTLQLWRFSEFDGTLQMDSDVYINQLSAVPAVQAGPQVSPRGQLYQLNTIGTAPSPLSLQLEQQPSTAIQVSAVTTAGPGVFVPPPGVNTLKVQKTGAGGAGSSLTAAGQGGGGKGGEYAENDSYPCEPGIPINYYVGQGGGRTAAFVQRVATGFLSSVNQTTFTGNVLNGVSVTGNKSLLVFIGFGVESNHVIQVSDTVGNTYIKDFAATPATTGYMHLEVWRVADAVALDDNDQITVVLDSPTTNGAAFICNEYSPLGTPDVSNFAFSLSNVATLGDTATMLADDDVAVSAVCVFSGNAATQINPAAGYTTSGPEVAGGSPGGFGGTMGHGLFLASSYKLTPGAGSSTATFNWNSGSVAPAVGVILGYPSQLAQNVNGEDTWFGADDISAGHGGQGLASNTTAGQTLETGSSTDPIVFTGGNGGTGGVGGGGGGGQAGGPGGNGGSGTQPGGGTGPGQGAGGAGGAPGGNNPGSAGTAPGGAGGGAVSAGGTVAGGGGAAGKLVLTWTGQLSPFKTCLVHHPGPDVPPNLSPIVPVGAGNDVPNGSTQYTVPSGVASLNARFGGTYTVLLTSSSWDTPGSSRTVTVQVNQYEYPGGPSVSTSCALTLVPNNYDILNRTTPSGNGFIVVGEVTLPVRDMADDQTSAYFTVTVTSTDTSDRFYDVVFLDTEGQTVIIDINSSNQYFVYYLDAPDPNTDLGHLLGSAYDRSQAVSIIDSTLWSGGPVAVLPGNNPLMVYAMEGQPALVGTYDPCWFVDRLM